MRKPMVLCILDGVGIREENKGNALIHSNTPNFDKLYSTYPHSLLNASEHFVGLPDGQMGNSEVGHTNIGAGRVIFQPLLRINNSIEDKTFFSNEKFIKAIRHAKDNDSKLNIMGLLSDGGVHSDINHLFALLDLCNDMDFKNVVIHVFLDGRDTLMNSALKYIEMLEEKLDQLGFGSIATITGRYYAMDRDSNYDRTKIAYDAIVSGIGDKIDNIEHAIKRSYEDEIYDEFFKPVIYRESFIEDDDSLIWFNFRPDRGRQIMTAITNPGFNKFETHKFNNLYSCSMRFINDTVKSDIAFINPEIKNTLGEVLSDNNLTQLRIAETEKYAHVTYFFDGGVELDLKGKEQILVPSPKVATYDLKPEMSVYEITDKLLSVIDNYDVVILNYANGDMVGHTGNFEAAIKALEDVDACLGRLYEKVEELKGTLLVTADHGNCDEMIDDNGNKLTTHSLAKVPFIITKKDITLSDGSLCDIAPTMLELLNVAKPVEMTGKSLVDFI